MKTARRWLLLALGTLAWRFIRHTVARKVGRDRTLRRALSKGI